MHLPIGRWNGAPRPTSPEATDFVEVVYEADEVLVVMVATDLADDTRLADALIDAIATAPRAAAAESAIETIADAWELEVRAGQGSRERRLSLAPASPTNPPSRLGLSRSI